MTILSVGIVATIGLTHLEEMKINTGPNPPLVTSKPYPLPLKHKFLKETENLLEA